MNLDELFKAVLAGNLETVITFSFAPPPPPSPLVEFFGESVWMDDPRSHERCPEVPALDWKLARSVCVAGLRCQLVRGVYLDCGGHFNFQATPQTIYVAEHGCNFCNWWTLTHEMSHAAGFVLGQWGDPRWGANWERRLEEIHAALAAAKLCLPGSAAWNAHHEYARNHVDAVYGRSLDDVDDAAIVRRAALLAEVFSEFPRAVFAG